ncbi:MAG: hypothetical protein ABW098_03825 [Candidatus Thiodiazotropha sp.]
MSKQLSQSITAKLEQNLSQYKFSERYDEVTENIVGIVKKPWKPLQRVFGGHGIAAVITVPETITERESLKAFFKHMRKEITSKYVGYAAYKSSHSFVVLVCPHELFTTASGIASELKDRTGLHMNIIQGVVLVDSQTREVASDYTRPLQYKGEYNAVLSAANSEVK